MPEVGVVCAALLGIAGNVRDERAGNEERLPPDGITAPPPGHRHHLKTP
jgi:hypothetical protein